MILPYEISHSPLVVAVKRKTI